MIRNSENTNEGEKVLTFNMKLALTVILLSTARLALNNIQGATPIDTREFNSYIGLFSSGYGLLKLICSKAPLPKEPEEYMLTDAIRFRREGLIELGLGLSSLAINNIELLKQILIR